MDFKTCKYYERALEEEHCPFDCCCDLNCYFTNNKIQEDLKDLQKEYNELEDELQYKEDCEEERDELIDERDGLQHQLDEMFDYVITVLKSKIDNIDLNTELDFKEFDYDYTQKIREMLEMLEKYEVSSRLVEIPLPIVCEDSKYMPQYANDTDACMDLKIKVTKEIGVEKEPGVYATSIGPNESIVVSTGIKMKIPENYFVQIFPRSSTGFKLHCRLANTVGIIDTGYRDEIKLKIHNFGNESVLLEDGQRIAQFILLPRPKINLQVVEDNEEFQHGDRGGGIGSSGK